MDGNLYYNPIGLKLPDTKGAISSSPSIAQYKTRADFRHGDLDRPNNFNPRISKLNLLIFQGLIQKMQRCLLPAAFCPHIYPR